MKKANHSYLVSMATPTPATGAPYVLAVSLVDDKDIAKSPSDLTFSWRAFSDIAHAAMHIAYLVRDYKITSFVFSPDLDLDLDQALTLASACGLDTVETIARVQDPHEVTRQDFYRVRIDPVYGWLFDITYTDKRGYISAPCDVYPSLSAIKTRLSDIAQYHPVLAASAWKVCTIDELRYMPALYTIDTIGVNRSAKTLHEQALLLLSDPTIRADCEIDAANLETRALSLFTIAYQVNDLGDLVEAMQNMDLEPSQFLRDLAQEDDQDYLDVDVCLEEIGDAYRAAISLAMEDLGLAIPGVTFGPGWDDDGYCDLAYIDPSYFESEAD